nr:hypothetical protein [Candidatus Woesearchaeota archaeon]
MDLKVAFLVGLLSALVDLDHLFSFHKRHKKWSLKSTWEMAIVRHEQEKSFIQHRKGLVSTTLILVVLFFISQKLTMILALAYYTHYFLDHLHINVIQQHKIKKIFGIHYPFNYYELILDGILILLLIFMFVI